MVIGVNVQGGGLLITWTFSSVLRDQPVQADQFSARLDGVRREGIVATVIGNQVRVQTVGAGPDPGSDVADFTAANQDVVSLSGTPADPRLGFPL